MYNFLKRYRFRFGVNPNKPVCVYNMWTVSFMDIIQQGVGGLPYHPIPVQQSNWLIDSKCGIRYCVNCGLWQIVSTVRLHTFPLWKQVKNAEQELTRAGLFIHLVKPFLYKVMVYKIHLTLHEKKTQIIYLFHYQFKRLVYTRTLVFGLHVISWRLYMRKTLTSLHLLHMWLRR